MAQIISLDAYRDGRGIVELPMDGQVSDSETQVVPAVAQNVEEVLAITARLNGPDRTMIRLRKPFQNADEVVQFKNELTRRGFIDSRVYDMDGTELVYPTELVNVQLISVAHDVADFIIQSLGSLDGAYIETGDDGIVTVKRVPQQE